MWKGKERKCPTGVSAGGAGAAPGCAPGPPALCVPVPCPSSAKKLQSSLLQRSQDTVQWAEEDSDTEGCKQKSDAVSTTNPAAKGNIKLFKKQHLESIFSPDGLWITKANKKMAGGQEQGDVQSKDRGFGKLGGGFLGSLPHLFL